MVIIQWAWVGKSIKRIGSIQMRFTSEFKPLSFHQQPDMSYLCTTVLLNYQSVQNKTGTWKSQGQSEPQIDGSIWEWLGRSSSTQSNRKEGVTTYKKPLEKGRTYNTTFPRAPFIPVDFNKSKAWILPTKTLLPLAVTLAPQNPIGPRHHIWHVLRSSPRTRTWNAINCS